MNTRIYNFLQLGIYIFTFIKNRIFSYPLFKDFRFDKYLSYETKKVLVELWHNQLHLHTKITPYLD